MIKLSKNQMIALGAIALFIGGAAVGRFSLPAKVETKIEEKIVVKEVIKWKEKIIKEENKNKETITVETRYPDGTVKKEKRVVDKGTILVDLSKESEKQKDTYVERREEHTVKNSKNDWQLAALGAMGKNKAGTPSTAEGIDYGAHVQRRIIGPFYLGAFGLQDKTIGASVGISW